MNPNLINAPHWYSFWIKNSSYFKTWPIGNLFFWLNLKLFPGVNLLYYKLLNIFFHALNAFFISKILRNLNIRNSSLLSIVYLVHPMHVETVSWAFQLLTILAATFFLISFLSFNAFANKLRLKCYFSSLLFFLFSLWTKSSMLFAPFLFIFLLWKNKASAKSYFLIIPFFLISALVGISLVQSNESLVQKSSTNIQTAQYQIIKKIPEIGIYAKTPPSEAPVAPYSQYLYDNNKLSPTDNNFKFNKYEVFAQGSWYYLSKLFAPIGLQFIYPKTLFPYFFLLMSLTLVIILPIILFKKTNNKNFVFIPILAITSLLPYLGLSYIPYFSWSFVSDRYSYLFIIVLPVLLGLIVLKNFEKQKIILLSFIVLMLAYINIGYGLTFNSPTILYSQILKNHPHPQIYALLFQEYLKNSDLKNAGVIVNEAKLKFPNDVATKDIELRYEVYKKNFK